MSGEMCSTCKICGNEEVHTCYSDYTCENCGQEYIYDCDCYRIELTEEQIKILRADKQCHIKQFPTHLL